MLIFASSVESVSSAEGFRNFNLVELILMISILEQDTSYHVLFFIIIIGGAVLSP
jgi:hypothetical protein